MTEPKSPREIAADAIIERLLDRGDAEAADELIALRSAVNRLKSYAAERERLLAEADEVIADEWGVEDALALDDDDEMKRPILAALGRHRRRGEAPAAPTSTSCAGTQPFDANRGNGE